MNLSKTGEDLFSLYIHVPFCEAKCGYCSFYSRIPRDADLENYLLAVALEASRLRDLWGVSLPVKTVYIGGGTPSALDIPSWLRLLNIIKGAFDLSETVEFTVEANPCSLSTALLDVWKDFGVTRLSIGVQSLNDEELKWLGRLHDARTAESALEKAVSFGFDVSADLIFASQPQTLRT